VEELVFKQKIDGVEY
jgi:metal-dependent HD superfamily phosphatase/phosphodiesterase